MKTLYYKVVVTRTGSLNSKRTKVFTVVQSNTDNEDEDRKRAEANAIEYARVEWKVLDEDLPMDTYDAEILEIIET